jgi:hypothetical protein
MPAGKQNFISPTCYPSIYFATYYQGATLCRGTQKAILKTNNSLE